MTLSPTTNDPLIGKILAERYRITELVGSGRFSIVYKGQHLFMDRAVAMKTLQSNLVEDQTVIKRFEKEAVALSKLRHPNIVSVYDCFMHTNGQPFLVMDFLDGHTLEELLTERGAIPPKLMRAIIFQSSAGLAHAHGSGVLHRDIKPDNIILLPREKTDERVRLLDFGFALLQGDLERLTLSGTLCGSPAYISPERWKGKELDARSDIYSLAVVMFQGLTGQLPFKATSLEDLRNMHVSQEPPLLGDILPILKEDTVAQTILNKAMSKNPDDRYQTMKEFHNAVKLWAPNSDDEEIAQWAKNAAPKSAQKPGQPVQAQPVSLQQMPPQAVTGSQAPGTNGQGLNGQGSNGQAAPGQMMPPPAAGQPAGAQLTSAPPPAGPGVVPSAVQPVTGGAAAISPNISDPPLPGVMPGAQVGAPAGSPTGAPPGAPVPPQGAFGAPPQISGAPGAPAAPSAPAASGPATLKSFDAATTLPNNTPAPPTQASGASLEDSLEDGQSFVEQPEPVGEPVKIKNEWKSVDLDDHPLSPESIARVQKPNPRASLTKQDVAYIKAIAQTLGDSLGEQAKPIELSPELEEELHIAPAEETSHLKFGSMPPPTVQSNIPQPGPKIVPVVDRRQKPANEDSSDDHASAANWTDPDPLGSLKPKGPLPPVPNTQNAPAANLPPGQTPGAPATGSPAAASGAQQVSSDWSAKQDVAPWVMNPDDFKPKTGADNFAPIKPLPEHPKLHISPVMPGMSGSHEAANPNALSGPPGVPGGFTAPGTPGSQNAPGMQGGPGGPGATGAMPGVPGDTGSSDAAGVEVPWTNVNSSAPVDFGKIFPGTEGVAPLELPGTGLPPAGMTAAELAASNAPPVDPATERAQPPKVEHRRSRLPTFMDRDQLDASLNAEDPSEKKRGSGMLVAGIAVAVFVVAGIGIATWLITNVNSQDPAQQQTAGQTMRPNTAPTEPTSTQSTATTSTPEQSTSPSTKVDETKTADTTSGDTSTEAAEPVKSAVVPPKTVAPAPKPAAAPPKAASAPPKPAASKPTTASAKKESDNKGWFNIPGFGGNDSKEEKPAVTASQETAKQARPPKPRKKKPPKATVAKKRAPAASAPASGGYVEVEVTPGRRAYRSY